MLRKQHTKSVSMDLMKVSKFSIPQKEQKEMKDLFQQPGKTLFNVKVRGLSH